MAGPQQTPYVQAVALTIDARLGAIGTTIDLIAPPHAMPIDGDLAALCARIVANDNDRLLTFGTNPVATAFRDVAADATLRRLRLIVHCGLYRDRTAALAHWHVPLAHELESWSDLRAHNGTASIVQPLIQPQIGGKTVHEIVAALGGDYGSDALSLVRATWKDRLDDDAWRKALRDGFISGTAAGPASIPAVIDLSKFKPGAASRGLEARFTAHPFLRDRRHANSAMLQELPHPITKIVWGNALLISAATAERLQLQNRQAVELKHGERRLTGAIWIMPGHADDVVTVSLGHGQGDSDVARLALEYDGFQLPVFRHDGAARPAFLLRHCNRCGDSGAVVENGVGSASAPGGRYRPLLAFRGYCLAVPVSATLSGPWVRRCQKHTNLLSLTLR